MREQLKIDTRSAEVRDISALTGLIDKSRVTKIKEPGKLVVAKGRMKTAMRGAPKMEFAQLGFTDELMTTDFTEDEKIGAMTVFDSKAIHPADLRVLKGDIGHWVLLISNG